MEWHFGTKMTTLVIYLLSFKNSEGFGGKITVSTVGSEDGGALARKGIHRSETLLVRHIGSSAGTALPAERRRVDSQ